MNIGQHFAVGCKSSNPMLDSILVAWMMCMGRYEIKTPTCKKVIVKNKCKYTNDKLENGLMYLN